MIDSHAHIYSEEYDDDRDEMIARAKEAGVQCIILPNVDDESLPRILATEQAYPDYCIGAIGIHPTSVGENYEELLAMVECELKRREWKAIGEVGIDLYWDKTYEVQQVEVFRKHIEWALECDLPIIIHARNSTYMIIEILKEYKGKGLRGVFHCFSGSAEEAREIMKLGGFSFGIGGVLTFKNAGIAQVLRDIPLEYVMLETDAPYLTPVPYRGKRNESSYLLYVVAKMAEIYACDEQHVIDVTTANARKLFALRENV